MSAESRQKTGRFSILVAGGGGAGLAAAVAAAEAGAKNIAVLEKHSATGGTSAMASGIFAAESQVQKRQVITVRKDDMYRRIMDWTHLSVNPRIVRAYIEKSADTVHWLEEKGLRFNCLPHSPIDNPLTWHVPKGNGAEIMKTLLEECRKLGVKIYLNYSLKKIEKDNKGKVTGITAGNKDGNKVFKAAATIIATGGFAGDRDLLKKYCPKFRGNMKLSGAANKGEGIFMAYEAGAGEDGLGGLMIGGPFGVGPRILTLGKEPDVVRLQMIFITGEPSCVWINTQGRRFIDETASFNYYEGINAVIRQTEGMCCALFDSGLVKRITETGLCNVPSGFEFGERHRSPLPPGLDKELRAQADKGLLKISDNWDDIADYLEIDRRSLKDTVKEYNDSCRTGCDPVFAKNRKYLVPLDNPPYYGTKMAASYLNTLGGIKINEDMEVLDKQDNPIPGLYAAGVDTGGWTSDTYCAALPGTAFGYAINSGRIAGENAFKYTEKRR